MRIVLAYLTDPFATMYLPLILAILRLLRQAIVTLWPRIEYYEGDVLKAVTVCWIRLEDDGRQTEDSELIRQESRTIVRLLAGTTNPKAGENVGYRTLAQSHPRLAGLFQSMPALQRTQQV